MTDKIIFWLNADLSTFGLAKFLQEKHDCELYAIIETTNKPKKFFETQDFIKFQKKWFYFDHVKKPAKPDLDYLKNFEEKYKINLWLLAYNERLFYRFNQFKKFSENEVLSILEQECKLFEKILDEIKPDFFITNLTTLHHMHLFYELCKAKGVETIMTTAAIGGRLFLDSKNDEGGRSSEFKKLLNETNDTRLSNEEIISYLNKFDPYKQNINFKKKFQTSKIDLVKAFLKYMVTPNTNIKTHYSYYGRTKSRVLIKTFLSELKTKYRLSFINKKFQRSVNNSDKFIYYPLHLEQERVLLIDAPFLTNQLEIITNIVKSLPIGYRLYVKEHPLMNIRNWRSIFEYKKIMNLPNVRLIHPSVPSKELIEKCSLVVTISGTSGLEAAFYNKPTITLKTVPYGGLSSVHVLEKFEDLPKMIVSVLKEKVDLLSLKRYLNYIEKNSFECDLVDLIADMENYFHSGGFFVDIEISPTKMKMFLDKHRDNFDLLASEHIKKIQQCKESKTVI